MVDILLAGNRDKTWTNSYPSGYKGYQIFTAVASGTVSELRAYTLGTGDPNWLRLALYADSSNSPGTLLAQAVGGGGDYYAIWHSLPVSDVSVSEGVNYWIGVQVYNNGVALRGNSSTTSTSKYASSTWSDFVSSPSGLSAAAWDIATAAWGEESIGGGASIGLIGYGLCGNSPLVGQILA